MKKLKISILVVGIILFSMLMIFSSVSATDTTSQELNFKDQNLQKAFLEMVGKSENEKLTMVDIETRVQDKTLSFNSSYAKQIEDLSGIEIVINKLKIEDINISESNITTLEPLKSCISLKEIYIDNGKINNISALENLINLEILDLRCNQIEDISSLANITNLTFINLESNKIIDISALKNLTNLEDLYLSDNQITSISALKNVKKLRSLWAYRNKIEDISSLSDITTLEDLRAENNKISDISCLKKLKNLKTIYLDNNNVSDISVVANFTNLEVLSMVKNNIKDITAIKNLNKLSLLRLSNNKITNISSIPVESIINSSDDINSYSGYGHYVCVDGNYIDYTKQENQQIVDRFKKVGWTEGIEERDGDIFAYNPQNKEEITSITLSENKIKIDTNTNVVPQNTKLLVEEVTKGDNYNTVSKSVEKEVSKFILYDISLESNNVKIQPSGKVKVSIPLPTNYDKANVIVYRVEDNGNKIEYNTKIEKIDNEEYVTFETDHFSNYVVAEKKIEESKDHKLDNEPKTGIVSIISIIGSLFIIATIGIVINIKKMYK